MRNTKIDRGKTRRNMKKKGTRRRRGRHTPQFYIGGSPDKCIFVPLGGGLGNQMYVYAAALTVMNKKKTLPMCLLPIKTDHSPTDYRLVLFKRGIPVEDANIKERMNAAKDTLDKVKNPHNAWENTDIEGNDSTNIHLAGAFSRTTIL